MDAYFALAGSVIAVVTLLGGWTQFLHSQRTKAFDQWRVASEKAADDWRRDAARRMDRIDADIRGMQVQFQAYATDLAKGYVQRSEFIVIANRIEETVTAANARVDRLIESLTKR
ncbi:MAG TPA: hypothetical protein VFW56_11890 [Bradyrhizobium sp.]|nr:hypothetical protein [Bradyrhizobium sp.]